MAEQPPLTPPPRDVPFPLALRVRLGGFLPAVGWIMLAIGGFLSTVFISNSEFATWIRFATELAATTGKVVDVAEANAEINERQVLLIEFEFEADGHSYRAISYSDAHVPSIGGEVDVEYAVDDPAVARIKGMRSAPFPAIVALSLLFPFVAVVLLTVSWFKAKNRLWLMRNADSHVAVLTDREMTSTRVNNQPVYKLTFQFVDADGKPRSVVDRSHRRELQQDDVPRSVLYANSGNGCLIDLIPGKPRVLDGQWQPASLVSVLIALLLPIFAVAMLYLASYIEL